MCDSYLENDFQPLVYSEAFNRNFILTLLTKYNSDVLSPYGDLFSD